MTVIDYTLRTTGQTARDVEMVFYLYVVDERRHLVGVVSLRRLLLVTWIGSHYAFATEAQELGEGFTVDTIPLAEAYLASYE